MSIFKMKYEELILLNAVILHQEVMDAFWISIIYLCVLSQLITSNYAISLCIRGIYKLRLSISVLLYFINSAVQMWHLFLISSNSPPIWSHWILLIEDPRILICKANHCTWKFWRTAFQAEKKKSKHGSQKYQISSTAKIIFKVTKY